MCLVGVAGVGCKPGQLRPARPGVDPGNEPPEPQYPSQRRWPIPGCRTAAAEHLPLTHSKPGGDVTGLSPGAAEEPGSVGDQRIGRAWSPAAEREWRGAVTMDALHLLRANGRC